MAEPAKRKSVPKRGSMFQDIFSSSKESEKNDAVVGHMLKQTSPVSSPVTSRRGSSQLSLPIQESAAAPRQSTEQDESLWFETARSGVGWGPAVVLLYITLGIIGGFIFWWQNDFLDSLVDCMFMTVSAITGSSLSSVLLQKSNIGALVTINVLAFISSPTWSDLMFIIMWYFKVCSLLRDISGQNSGNAAVDVSMAKAVYALRLEKGTTIFAGFFLLVYSFAIVLLCTVVGGVYLTYGLEESFPDKCFGYPCFWVSWFDSVGNFANSGFTLNPAGFAVYVNHPFLPLLMCFCMSSGIMFRTSFMTLCLSAIRRFSTSENLNVYCDHFFQQSVILRTLFDLNAPQMASFVYNLLITFSCTIFFFFAESHQRSVVTGSDTVFNQLVMFFFLAMSVRWSGTTVMDLSKFGAGSQLVMFCVLGLLEVPFDKCDDGTNTLKSAFRRFTLGANFLYIFVPLGWILMCQIGSSNSFNSFYCMFEVMSAFFNSGVTIANQDNADLASLSYIGSLPHASKIVLLFVMLAGRFRKVSALPASCKEAIASWKASPSSVLDMRALNQSSGQVVLAHVEGQIEPGIQDLLNLLETVPVIQSLSRSQQISLCRLVSLQNFSHGDTIIRQGDAGENAFIISSGSAEVKKVISPGGAEISLVTLQRGAFFGELALINNAPRGASVYANGETSCIVISKSIFETIRDSVVSDSKARELGYALSEVDALRLKIDDLEGEISTLRRRKSISASDILVSAPTKAEASLFQSASPAESVSLPGSAVDAPLPLTTHSRAPSRPVIKTRRVLLSLPAPTPR